MVVKVVVKIFFTSFELAHVFDRTNWHEVKLLKIVFFHDVPVSDGVTIKGLPRISDCLSSDIIKLLDLLL